MKHTAVLFLIICCSFVALHPVKKNVDPKDVFILNDNIEDVPGVSLRAGRKKSSEQICENKNKFLPQDKYERMRSQLEARENDPTWRKGVMKSAIYSTLSKENNRDDVSSLVRTLTNIKIKSGEDKGKEKVYPTHSVDFK